MIFSSPGARSATMNGTTYRRNDVLACDTNDEEPTFCEVVDILDTTVSQIFVVQLFAIVSYSQHYHAYEVAPAGNITVYRHSDFVDYHPLHKCRS